jgi:hypothetical protein
MRIGKPYQNFPKKSDKFLAWQVIAYFWSIPGFWADKFIEICAIIAATRQEGYKR